MKNKFLRRRVQIVLRLILGGVFLYSGFLKLQNPQVFADNIFAYQVVPAALIAPFALALPPLEIIFGLMLITCQCVRASSFGLMFLCATFAIALLQALARGLEVDCGCFGQGQPSILKTWVAVGRDVLLFGLCLSLYIDKNSMK